ncbi:unnamed protein product [Dracunculus medinensis]|uniref:SCP domain-containing protein n=1 Tax=Dracunculus medinensis TaxID=318479 RepID=A0A0N4U5H6_DRAME|nr:unnamed protein product [Dracunculus medinensis]
MKHLILFLFLNAHLGVLDGISKKKRDRTAPIKDEKLCLGSKIFREERDQILSLHNKLRSELAAGKVSTGNGTMPQGSDIRELRWDCKLEKTAQWWADRCLWKHSDVSDRNYKGENLYKVQQTIPIDRSKRI